MSQRQGCHSHHPGAEFLPTLRMWEPLWEGGLPGGRKGVRAAGSVQAFFKITTHHWYCSQNGSLSFLLFQSFFRINHYFFKQQTFSVGICHLRDFLPPQLDSGQKHQSAAKALLFGEQITLGTVMPEYLLTWNCAISSSSFCCWKGNWTANIHFCLISDNLLIPS